MIVDLSTHLLNTSSELCHFPGSPVQCLSTLFMRKFFLTSPSATINFFLASYHHLSPEKADRHQSNWKVSFVNSDIPEVNWQLDRLLGLTFLNWFKLRCLNSVLNIGDNNHTYTVLLDICAKVLAVKDFRDLCGTGCPVLNTAGSSQFQLVL